MLSKLAIFSTFLLTVGACSSDSGGGGGDGSDGGNNNTDDGGAADADTTGGESFTVTWGPFDVPAGTENTKCVITKIENLSEIHVGSITNVLGSASHHFIVYRISEGEVTPDPYDCQPFVGTLNPAEGAPLMVTQKAEETLTFPEGVAISLQPGQLIRLEMHYLNATSETQTVTATSTFTSIPDSEFVHEADFLFIGNPDIDLPPGQSTSLVTDFLPLPDELIGANIFGITGHTHQWGTDVTVALRQGADGPQVMLYDIDNFNWDEPDTIRLDPAPVIAAGDGFSFTCEWNNRSGQSVTFGESVDEEMCFFWAYYYPSVGPKVCVHSTQGAQFGVTDLCCPGDALCAFLDNVL